MFIYIYLCICKIYGKKFNIFSKITFLNLAIDF